MGEKKKVCNPRYSSTHLYFLRYGDPCSAFRDAGPLPGRKILRPDPGPVSPRTFAQLMNETATPLPRIHAPASAQTGAPAEVPCPPAVTLRAPPRRLLRGPFLRPAPRRFQATVSCLEPRSAHLDVVT